MAGDTHYSSVVLLLSCDGNNNSTTFIDSSSYAHTVTAYNGAKLMTAAGGGQVKFGTAAAYFAGTDDYLGAPHATNFDLPGDFTVEAWIYPTSLTSTHTIVGSQNASTPLLAVNSTGKLATQIDGDWSYATTGSVTTGAWQHVAMVRSGTTITFFVNGASVGSITKSTSWNISTLSIGVAYPYSFPYVGYIDDLRITKGVARYTSDFSPPTEAFPDYPYVAANAVLAVPYWIRHRQDSVTGSVYENTTIHTDITDVDKDGSGGVWAVGNQIEHYWVYQSQSALPYYARVVLDHYDAQGSVLSTTLLERYDQSTSEFGAPVLTTVSGVPVVGYSCWLPTLVTNRVPSLASFRITRCDTSGVPLWRVDLLGGSDWVTKSTGSIAVAGSHIYAATGMVASSPSYYAVVAKLAAANGTISWQRKITPNTPTYDALIPAGIAAIADGNVYVAATAQVSGTDKVGIVYKYNSSGTIQWQKIITIGTDGKCLGLAIDSSENVYAAVVCSDTSTVHVVCVATGGTLTWQRNIVFTGQLVEAIGGITWDSTNSKIYVTATVDSDHYISRLTAAGAVDWTRKIYRTTGGRDTAGKIKVDPTNGVFLLAGSSV